MNRSLKRARILFIDPGYGLSDRIENKGCVDEELRYAIPIARKAFDDACKEWKKLKLAAPTKETK